MFEIAKNQIIKIHKGDDSGYFPLYINQGTRYDPKPFMVYPSVFIARASEHLEFSFDTKIFSKKEKQDGFFDFEYNYLYNDSGKRIGNKGWYLNKQPVDLSEYGITLYTEAEIWDHIVIVQNNKNPTEIVLYILEIHASLDEWLIKKTFLSTNETYTEFAPPYTSTICVDRETIDEENRILLSIDSDDIRDLNAGEYCYQIKANIYDPQEDKYITQTITPRLPFYVIDGEEAMLW